MLRTSGNANTNTNNGNSTPVNKASKTNLLNTSNLMMNSNADFMLPTINNLNTNQNPIATTSYLNDYKLYRDVSLFQPAHQATLQQQAQSKQANLIGNSMTGTTLNNLVVNNLASLNNLGNHTNSLSTIQSPHTNNLVNGLQANHKQQQQQQQLINNPDFMIYFNRCNQFLELSMYQQALEEINHALSLVSSSAHARFRKAQALLGLKRFYDCEKELWNCINLEPNVLEYRKELLKVKQLALMSLNLNLDHNMILMAAQKYDSIKDAVDALMWSNNVMDFNYGNQAAGLAFQQQQTTPNANNPLTSNETSLMNGWNLNLNSVSNAPPQPTNNRFGSINQHLMNNGNNLLFNNGLMSNNLLLNNNASNLVNRSNNGTSVVSNNVVTTSSAAVNLKQPQTPNSTSNSNNLINSNNTSSSAASIVVANSNSLSVNASIAAANNQQTSNSPLSDVTSNLTNGLSNGNRFNYLLRNLEQTHHPLLSAAAVQQQQSTNGQNNSNQNLINNQQQQQQLYNRILPSFIDSTTPTNNSNSSGVVDQQSKSNQAVLNCTRSLSSKLTLNDTPTSPSILNGTNGLLINNSAPSPICSKLNTVNQQATNNNSSSNSNSNLNTNNSTNLMNSCNFNIFNQMPEMKLIETIVPNLLGSLSAGGNSSSLNNHNSSSSTTNNQSSTDLASNSSTLINNNNNSSTVAINQQSNQIQSNDLTQSNTNHKLLVSLASAAVVSGKQQQEVNKVKDSLMSNLQQQQSQLASNPLSQEASFDDCNKNANSKTDLIVDKLDKLLTTAGVIKLDSGVGVVDLKSSNNSASVKDECASLLTSLSSLTTSPRDASQASSASIKSESNVDSQTSVSLSSNVQSTGIASAASSITPTVTSASSTTPLSAPIIMQCTSYSDIVKRAKKTSPQSTIPNGLAGSGVSLKDSTSHSISKSDNDTSADDSIASKRPTNLWGYNGLRVANVSLTASKSSLMSLFSKFGRIRLLERIINKTTTNNIWVYYDNPISPVDAVTKLQNVYIENICVDSDSPLRLFFAPTDDQKDLKFSRPKQPPDNKGRGECYYWRTTNCFSKEQCPLLHIQANKNIDAQVWMRVNPENNPENTETTKDAEEEENSNNQNAENNEAAPES